jgi:transposase
MASIEVLSGAERRRRWSEEQKRELIAAAFAPGAVVQDIARRADVTPSQIYRWRRDFQAESVGFAAVLMAPPGGDEVPPSPPAIEIEFSGNGRVRIPLSTSPGLAAAVVGALARR